MTALRQLRNGLDFIYLASGVFAAFFSHRYFASDRRPDAGTLDRRSVCRGSGLCRLLHGRRIIFCLCPRVAPRRPYPRVDPLECGFRRRAQDT